MPNHSNGSGSGAGSSVGIEVDTISAVALEGGFPRNDGASLDRFGVTGQGAIAVDGLIGARGAHTSELHPQGVSHGVLLSQAQELVASILKVSHARQGDAPGFGGRNRQVETFGFVVIGDDFLGVGVSLQGSIGQAVKTCHLVKAVHVKGSAGNGEDTACIGHRRGRGENVGVAGAEIDESASGASANGDTSERRIDISRCQWHQINIIAEGR